LSANPALTPEKICKAIKMNAKDLGDPGLDHWYGAGRVNVYEALINVLTTLEADNHEPPIGSTVNFALEGPADALYGLLGSLSLGTTVLPRFGTLDIAPILYILDLDYLDATGNATFAFHIPPAPGLSGLQVHFQSITDDTMGATGLYLISLHETITIQ
jgi:hypothetical protein